MKQLTLFDSLFQAKANEELLSITSHVQQTIATFVESIPAHQGKDKLLISL